MTWLLLLACNSGVTEDSEVDPDRLIRVYGDGFSTFGAWCAERADHTLSCFGTADLLQDGPGDLQWSDVDPLCGCGLDLGGDPVCWLENAAVSQLPSGPYSRLVCSADWAWAIRADTGEFVVHASDMGTVNMEVGAKVRDVLTENIVGTGQPNCYLTFEEGLIVCEDHRDPETEFILPEGSFDSLTNVAGIACGLRSDGSTACFRSAGGTFPGDLPEWPKLKELGWGLGLTLEHELIELTFDAWSEEYSLPLGGLYQSYFTPQGGFDMGIPMDDPYVVDCLDEAVEEMDIPPPGWEQ
ncbi:MAG: hypothetical protein ACI9VR_002878 [Cognaticolwellia sp.]|jgi:hypothetical protein